MGNHVDPGKISRAYNYGYIGASLNQLEQSSNIPKTGITEMAFKKGVMDRNAGKLCRYITDIGMEQEDEEETKKDDTTEDSDNSAWYETFWNGLLKFFGFGTKLNDAVNDTNIGDAYDFFSDVMDLMEMPKTGEETKLNMIIHTYNVMSIGLDNSAEPMPFVGDTINQGDGYVDHCTNAYETMGYYALVDVAGKNWDDLTAEEQATLVGCMRAWDGVAFGDFTISTYYRLFEKGVGIVW